jgi:hypothetical protein
VFYLLFVNAFQVNGSTGFIESASPNRKSFDSHKKSLMLETALKSAEAGNLPDLPNLCKAVGISISSFWSHYNQDPEFKAQYDEVLRNCEHTLANVMFERGKRPGGFMDRIAWLKRHFPEWREDRGTQISLDVGQLKKIIEPNSFIDAEIVPVSPQPPTAIPAPQLDTAPKI